MGVNIFSGRKKKREENSLSKCLSKNNSEFLWLFGKSWQRRKKRERISDSLSFVNLSQQQHPWHHRSIKCLKITFVFIFGLNWINFHPFVLSNNHLSTRNEHCAQPMKSLHLEFHFSFTIPHAKSMIHAWNFEFRNTLVNYFPDNDKISLFIAI